MSPSVSVNRSRCSCLSMLPETMFNLSSSPIMSKSVLPPSLNASRPPGVRLVEWKLERYRAPDVPSSQRLSTVLEVYLIRNASRWPQVTPEELHVRDGQVKDVVQPVGTW